MGIVNSIPELGSGREEMLLGAIRDGYMLPVSWHPVSVSYGPYTGEVFVSGDGVRIGDGAGSVRINVSHALAQQIADELGVVLPTAKISDEIWAQAQIKLAPVTQPWSQDGTMAKTYRMIQQSGAVDGKIAAAGGGGGQLIADVGKDWINSARSWAGGGSAKAVNYGWHMTSGGNAAATPAGQRVIQSPGMAHGMTHVDYSQTLRLVRRDVTVCGGDIGGCQVLDIDQVVTNPALAGLISHEGVLPTMHHPSTSDIQPCSGSSCSPPAPPPPSQQPPGARVPGSSAELGGALTTGKKAAIVLVAATAGYLTVRLIT